MLGFCVLYAVPNVLYSFTVILLRESERERERERQRQRDRQRQRQRELIALLQMSSCCREAVDVLCPCLQCVIVAFPGHTYFFC